MALTHTTFYRVAAACDAVGTDLRPAAVVVRNGTIAAIDTPGQLQPQAFPDAQVVDLPDQLVIPAMVNAHAHLDLTGLGPRPYRGHFQQWLKDVIHLAPLDPDAIRQAVHQGAALSREAGVGWVGDIAATTHAIDARKDTHLPGVSYLQFLGRGKTHRQWIPVIRKQLDQLQRSLSDVQSRELRLGISPHAPYSADQALYRAATRVAVSRVYRLCTHLAETPDELAFVRDAAGPFAHMLRELGKWSDTIKPADKHPVLWMARELFTGRWLLAHCNYVSPRHIRRLARYGAAVAYCPIASEYFGHPQPGYPPHAYLQMLDQGINVCLGTDSILCQPPDEPQPLGILPQMRRLYQRDGTDPKRLLRMATVNGLLALELDQRLATLKENVTARLVSVTINPDDPAHPLIQALSGRNPAQPLIPATDATYQRA